MVSFPLFLLAVAWLLYKLFSEKPCPPGHMYDMEKANEDMINGVSFDERERRKKRGEYWSPQSEVYDKRKTKELNEYCKKILYKYAKGYSTFYQSAWDSYKKRFKNNKDSNGNILPLDEEARLILFSFEKKCLTDFHIQRENCQSEIAALNNKHSDEATIERIRKEKWLAYYEQGIKDLYKELDISEKDDPNLQNHATASSLISEPVEQYETNNSHEQQKTEVESQSKYAMAFQIADDMEKNGSFLKNRCEQMLESYGFENSNLRMRSDCWKLITYKSNRKYGLFLKLPNYRQYDMSSASVFIYCVEAMCNVDLTSVGKSFAASLQIENHFSKEDIKLEYAHTRLFLDFHEVSPFSHKMHGLQGGVYYKNQFYSIKCGIEVKNDEEFLLEDFRDVFSLNETIMGNMIEQNNDADNFCLIEESAHTLLQHENNFDSMDGHEFENFCADILRKNGYVDVSVTRGSGDQGIDVIAYKDDVKYGIQCKCYATDVGNKAVQEVFSGKAFYNCHVGVVLTNSHFTNSAVELARSNGIVLWNREKLLQMIESAKRTEGETT